MGKGGIRELGEEGRRYHFKRTPHGLFAYFQRPKRGSVHHGNLSIEKKGKCVPDVQRRRQIPRVLMGSK